MNIVCIVQGVNKYISNITFIFNYDSKYRLITGNVMT